MAKRKKATPVNQSEETESRETNPDEEIENRPSSKKELGNYGGATPGIPKPKIQKFLKGAEVWEHSLFKLNVATAKKNVSFKLYQPILIPTEHAHFYHTKDRKGRTPQYCSAMAGHIHEVTIEWDGNDLKSFTCGPALFWKNVKIKGTDNFIKRALQISFLEVNKKTGDERMIEDNHIHEMTYLGTEELSNAIFKAQAIKDKAELAPHVSREMALQSESLKALKSSGDQGRGNMGGDVE